MLSLLSVEEAKTFLMVRMQICTHTQKKKWNKQGADMQDSRSTYRTNPGQLAPASHRKAVSAVSLFSSPLQFSPPCFQACSPINRQVYRMGEEIWGDVQSQTWPGQRSCSHRSTHHQAIDGQKCFSVEQSPRLVGRTGPDHPGRPYAHDGQHTKVAHHEKVDTPRLDRVYLRS